MPTDRPEVIWYSADIPPLYIFNGPLEGTGYGDVILNLVANTPPHRAAITRVWYEIEHHPVTCSTGAIKTPARESVALFSTRPAVVPNYQVIVRAELASQLSPYLTEAGRTTPSPRPPGRDPSTVKVVISIL